MGTFDIHVAFHWTITISLFKSFAQNRNKNNRKKTFSKTNQVFVGVHATASVAISTIAHIETNEVVYPPPPSICLQGGLQL